ncbi:MAG: DegT/DnrJ/EryC1/StrS family aminotransferase [Candidatus Omnitrophica bacterium]|nr:DegT/DnrJ/EryC1/StrS family aminotransferase [Candidatus Omnitrophota bacterium]
MKRIPLLDMKAQLKPIREDINKAIERVINSGSFILGKEVGKLEEEICKYTHAKYAIGVSNGTDAITLALEALGIGKGDRVIVPSFTYYATAGAITRIGAEPVFVDINPKTYCIDSKSVKACFEKAAKNKQRRIKAIIPVHLYGQSADMDKILKIAKNHNLKVIEDTAQSFGATYRYKKTGTMGDAGTVSFFPGKNLGACGDAGMVLTNNKKIADRLLKLRNQGAGLSDKYRHIHLGHNNRLDAIQASVLRVKLKFLDRWNKGRIKNAAYYNSALKDTGLMLPFVPKTNMHIYHQYVLKAKTRQARDRIVKHLNKKRVDSRVYYPIPLHLQPCFSYLGYKKGSLLESEIASQSTFAIPAYPELTVKELDIIICSIKEAL